MGLFYESFVSLKRAPLDSVWEDDGAEPFAFAAQFSPMDNDFAAQPLAAVFRAVRRRLRWPGRYRAASVRLAPCRQLSARVAGRKPQC